jgi:hypothetical protein
MQIVPAAAAFLLAANLAALAQTSDRPQGDTMVVFRLYHDDATCPSDANVRLGRIAKSATCYIHASQCPADCLLMPKEDKSPTWVCVRRE